MRTSVVIVGLALLPGVASATTWVGGDWAGQDLITADGDVLVGTFTNVGAFEVPSGAVVTVEPITPLEVHAQTVEVDGTIDGSGAGFSGGSGAFPNGFDGYPGDGPAPGEGGLMGPCVHGGGGGGGGHGSPGGFGGFYSPAYGLPAAGGSVTGTQNNAADRPMGSGGGGGGSDCYVLPGNNGGAGGASITLVALGDLTVDGVILAEGRPGLPAPADYPGGGGGGAGGTIVLDGVTVSGNGTLSAAGGDGGDAFALLLGYAGGGGGGAGGRVKVLYSVLGSNWTLDVGGGNGGADQWPAAMTYLSTAGGLGSYYLELTDPDPDADGVDVSVDNCPADFNPLQEDADYDGIGDVCDGCPTDPTGDSDGDGFCDTIDICFGGDDGDDQDGDGTPDYCDPCPFDKADDSDGDGVCDRRDVCPGDDDLGPDADADSIPDACDNCIDIVNEDQQDSDLDGAGALCDCDDFSDLRSPLLDEICNGIDDNCDGEVDEDSAEGAGTWYPDDDADGEGDGAGAVQACEQPRGYVSNDRDCNDETAFAWTGGTETCDDGLDNDCDGQIDPDAKCGDGDDDDKSGGGGCGCATGGPATPAALLLAGLIAARRRRR